MPANMALKRFKKAQRRKQIQTDRRKAELLDQHPAAEMRRAAQLPIRHCLVTQALMENGMGSLILVRGATPYQVTASVFLLDTFCLGIKDAFVRNLSKDEMEEYIESMEMAAPLAPIDPADARKLLGELAAWTRTIGFPPHRDYALAEQLFGDADPAASELTFRFGRDGKPFYMPGPGDSPSQIRRRVEHLRKALGEDGFDFTVFDEADEDDDELEEDNAIEPAAELERAPEPKRLG